MITPTMIAVKAFGSFTAAYGAYAFVRPAHLGRALGIDPDTAGRVSRVLGVRDLVSGASIVAARTSTAARAALTLRVVFDGVDAALLGALAPTRAGRRSAVAAASTWGALAIGLLLAERHTDAGWSR